METRPRQTAQQLSAAKTMTREQRRARATTLDKNAETERREEADEQARTVAARVGLRHYQIRANTLRKARK